MKTTYYIFVCALFFCFTAIEHAGAQGDLTTFDAEAAIDNKRPFKISDMSSEISFILLDDTNQESLVGDIFRIDESEDKIYISDGLQSSVKVFDKAGKFISTRGQIGRGPGEYIFSNMTAVDYEKDNIYINVSTTSKNIFMYNSDNRMTTSTDAIAFDSGKMTYFEDRLIVQNYPYLKPEKDGNVTFIDIFSSDLQHEGNIRIKHNATNGFFIRGNQILSNNGHELLVKEELNDTLFHYHNGALVPAYKLDMGKYFFSDKMWSRTMENSWNKYYQIYNIFEGNRYVFFVITNGIFGVRSVLIFDKHDLSGGFMAVGSDDTPGLFVDGIAFIPCYVRDNRLVGYMQALDIVDNAASITNPDLKALAATLREDSNPVIVVATLKK